jgi:hypothetical protein
LRRQLDNIEAEGRVKVKTTCGKTVSVETKNEPCSKCNGRTGVQKTKRRDIVTLEHGSFVAREKVRVCENRCKKPSGSLVTARSGVLAGLVKPGNVYGYDVEVHIGLERFMYHRQREEIRAGLKERYGITISSGQVSNMAKRFLQHLHVLHSNKAEVIREALALQGGYPLHIDCTGEEGRGVLLVAYAGWQDWVLGSWKIPTECSEKILPHLRETVALFGIPCAIVRDLGKAVTLAANGLVEDTGVDIPVLGCHLHFLADVGEDLLEKSYDQLRRVFRRFSIRSALRTLVRDLGRKLEPHLPFLHEEITEWIDTRSEQDLPPGRAGLAICRSLAQWALDYQSDGQNHGFPFDRPYFYLFERCHRVRRATDAYLRRPPDDTKVLGTLRRVARILDPVVAEPTFNNVARKLSERAALFDEVREALRIYPKEEAKKRGSQSTRPPKSEAMELRDIHHSIDTLTCSLRNRRPDRGPAEDKRQAIDIVLDHLDRHGPSLWGHVITITTAEGVNVRVVNRTNNQIESFFHKMKHDERRRSGRKGLSQDFEHLPAPAALVYNLMKPDYVHLLCGSLEKLPKAFSALDTMKAAQKGTTGPDASRRTFKEANNTHGALNSAERKFLRGGTLQKRIEAAARSRAPRYVPAGL